MQLTINKKKYNLVWGLPAISQFCENVGHEDDLEKAFSIAFPSEGDNVPVLKSIKARIELIHAALQVGAELEKKDLDLSITDIQVFIDNAEQSVIDAVFEDFFKSKYMGKSVESYLFVSEQEETPKKKSRQAS